MSTRDRQDQGKTTFNHDYNIPGFSKKSSHFRDGPKKGFNPFQPPVEVPIPPSKPDLPVIEIPDNPVEPPHQVPDSGAFTAIAFVLFVATVLVRRIKN